MWKSVEIARPSMVYMSKCIKHQKELMNSPLHNTHNHTSTMFKECITSGELFCEHPVFFKRLRLFFEE